MSAMNVYLINLVISLSLILHIGGSSCCLSLQGDETSAPEHSLKYTQGRTVLINLGYHSNTSFLQQ